MLAWIIHTEHTNTGLLPFISFQDKTFQIERVHVMSNGKSWKIFPINGKPEIFILNDSARYKPWPDTILNQGMVHSFFKENNVLFI